MVKKAATHIEVVLSFVLFLSFVFFLFAMMKPIQKTKSISLLDSVQYNLIQNFSTELSSVSIKLKNPVSSCFMININEFNCSSNLLTKNKTGKTISSQLQSAGEILIQYSGDFYTIYCSEEANQVGNLTGCAPIPRENYSIGIIKNYRYISYNKTSEFISLYNQNYEDAKEVLNLPQNADFALIIRNSTQNVFLSAKRTGTKSSNVFSKEVPIEIINSNGEIIPALLNIEIW